MTKLLELYTPLVVLVLAGFLLGRKLPKATAAYLGKFLFWIGVPVSIVAFLRSADLSGSIWIAPVVAWVAILLGGGLAWVWINWQAYRHRAPIQSWSRGTQGSFLLASMIGNTGYLGYPIILTFLGKRYFGWALFYDLLGTTLGNYGLGVVLAAYFGGSSHSWQLAQAILVNPALWSLGFGLMLRGLRLPDIAEQTLHKLAWTVVALSLMLIGMRLSQLNSWHNLAKASTSLGIKMLLVPLIVGSSLSLFGITGPPQTVIVLQMAMPPAFATLVIAEAYNLDRDLAVTALAMGSAGLLVTLPVWLLLFGS